MNYQKTLSDIMDDLIEKHEIKTGNRITGKSIAEALGIDPTAYSRLLKGDRNLKADEALKIAELFGVSCDEVMGREHTVTTKKSTLYGLSEVSSMWIEKNHKEHPERIELLNAILGHPHIADLLIDTLSLYINEHIPLLISTQDGVKPNLLRHLCDENTIIETIVSDDLKNVMKMLKNLYSKKQSELTEMNVALLIEKLNYSRDNLDKQISDFEYEQGMENMGEE